MHFAVDHLNKFCSARSEAHGYYQIRKVCYMTTSTILLGKMSVISLPVGVVLITLMCVPRVILAGCPSVCTCKQGILACEGRGLFTIPDEVPPDIGSIFFAYNNLTALGEATFIRFNSMSFLDISYNNIVAVSPQSFKTLVHLRVLNISRNMLTQLPSAIFFHLTSVSTIDLSYNRLVDCPLNLLEGAQLLSQINLQGNQLTPRVFEILKKVVWLHHVDLSYNPLYYLPYQMLYGLEHLQTLTLNSTRLQRVDPNAFLGLTGLIELHMNDNLISNLRREIFQPLAALHVLGIGGNSIICTCGVKQFQDWLRQSAVWLDRPTTCHYDKSASDIDIQTGNLAFFCDMQFHTTTYTSHTTITAMDPLNENVTRIAYVNTTEYTVAIINGDFNATDAADFNVLEDNGLTNVPYSANYSTDIDETWTLVTTRSDEILVSDPTTTPEVNHCANIASISLKLHNVMTTSAMLTWKVQGVENGPKMVVISLRRLGDSVAEYVRIVAIEQERILIDNMTSNNSYSICLTLQSCPDLFACKDISRVKETDSVPMIVDSACVRGSSTSTVVVLCVLVPLLVALVTCLLVVQLCACADRNSKKQALAQQESNHCAVDLRSARYQHAVRYQRNPVGPSRSNAHDRDGHTYESISTDSTVARDGCINIAYVNESGGHEKASEYPSVYYTDTDDGGYLKPIDSNRNAPDASNGSSGGNCSHTARPRPLASPPTTKRRQVDSGYKSGNASPLDRQSALRPPPKLPARSSPTNLDSLVPMPENQPYVLNDDTGFVLPTSPHLYTYVSEHK